MNLSEMQILLVEDSEDDVLLIRRAFKRGNVGTALTVLGDGDSAVAYLAGQAPYDDRGRHPLPQLMLLDLKLPRRSGLEVLEWARARPELRSMVVVVLTSSRENRDVDRAYGLGANSFLVKPVEFEKLCELVVTMNRYWMGLNEFAPSKEAP